MSITNTQRSEIRNLIIRRIKAAQEIERARHPESLAEAQAQVDQDPLIHEIKKYQAQYEALQEAERKAKQAKDDFKKVFRAYAEKLELKVSHGWSWYTSDDDFTHLMSQLIQAQRTQVTADALAGTPLQTKLDELEHLMRNLDDLITLATSQRELKQLVERINTSLGIASTQLETEILQS